VWETLLSRVVYEHLITSTGNTEVIGNETRTPRIAPGVRGGNTVKGSSFSH